MISNNHLVKAFGLRIRLPASPASLCPRGIGALTLAAMLAGCRGSDRGEAIATHPVRGSVLLGDGRPVPGGLVTFVPQGTTGRQAVGTLQEDGTFRLTTETPDDGIAEGRYRVRVEPFATGDAVTKLDPKAKIPGRYMDEDTSGIEVNIKAGIEVLDPFRLK
ncbi:carboxypeptidase-like regulatory domain-containing protein [Aquisphaera insulae]|uniref:carboxypeptidase-like regulatory domain-containing protein n=1 Tax=Aquisphaera insulae TaxID=2712864 RepID=UPI0013EC1BEA|nr:carboxypeptidase-like regulatory domain-containing protein [Aquisphaera insulae]